MDAAMVYTAFQPIFFVVIDDEITKPEINGFGAFLGGFEPTQMANECQN